LEHQGRSVQNRVWLIPLLYAVTAIATGFTVPRFSTILLPKLVSTMSVAAAIGFYSAIASGMIALTGVVFSLTFLMIQFSATAYSPRLVLWIARDPVTSHALGVFTATFLYALTALAWVDRSNSGRVPLSSVWLVGLLLLASIAMFISLIHRVGMLQVNRMLVFTGSQGRGVIASLYPSIETSSASSLDEMDQLPCTQTVQHHGDPRVLQAVDVPVLVQLAHRAGCVVEIMTAVGDSVLDSTPILRVLGGTRPLPRRLAEWDRAR